MNKLTIIQAGESLPFNFDRGDNSISGWTCTITIKQKPSDSSSAFMTPRVIPPVNNEWPGFLTQSETSGLAEGLYYLLASLVNVSTDEEEAIQVRFSVSTAWT